MSVETVTVINCHRLGIRKDPTITEFAEEIVGYADAGEALEANFEDLVYSWQGVEFVGVTTDSGVIGYANMRCLKRNRR